MISNVVLWDKIVRDISKNEKEFKTLGQGKWFVIYVDNNRLYVDCSRTHQLSCELNKKRPITISSFNIVCDLYESWEKGEVHARTKMKKSFNTAYILPLIKHYI